MSSVQQYYHHHHSNNNKNKNKNEKTREQPGKSSIMPKPKPKNYPRAAIHSNSVTTEEDDDDNSSFSDLPPPPPPRPPPPPPSLPLMPPLPYSSSNAPDGADVEYGSFINLLRRRTLLQQQQLPLPLPLPQQQMRQHRRDSSGSDDSNNMSDDDDDSFTDAPETIAATDAGTATNTYMYRVSMDECESNGLHPLYSRTMGIEARTFIMNRFLPAAEAMTSENPQNAAARRQVPPGRPPRPDPSPLPTPTLTPVRNRGLALPAKTRKPDSDSDSDGDEDAGLSTRACGFLPTRICAAFCSANDRDGSKTTKNSLIRGGAANRRLVHIIDEESVAATDDEDNVVQQIKAALKERRATKALLQRQQQQQQQQTRTRTKSKGSPPASNNGQNPSPVFYDAINASPKEGNNNHHHPPSCFETPRASMDGLQSEEFTTTPMTTTTMATEEIQFSPPLSKTSGKLGKGLWVDTSSSSQDDSATTTTMSPDMSGQQPGKVGWPLGISSCYNGDSPRKSPPSAGHHRSKGSPVSVLSPPLPKSPSESWLWRAIPTRKASRSSPLSSSSSSESSAKKHLDFPEPPI